MLIVVSSIIWAENEWGKCFSFSLLKSKTERHKFKQIWKSSELKKGI